MSFNPVQPSITLYILLLTSAPVLFSPPLQGYGWTRGLVHLLLWKTYPPDTLHAFSTSTITKLYNSSPPDPSIHSCKAKTVEHVHVMIRPRALWVIIFGESVIQIPNKVKGISWYMYFNCLSLNYNQYNYDNTITCIGYLAYVSL